MEGDKSLMFIFVSNLKLEKIKTSSSSFTLFCGQIHQILHSVNILSWMIFYLRRIVKSSDSKVMKTILSFERSVI